MKAGELRDRVLIRCKTTSMDDERNVIQNYDGGVKIWANMSPVGGEISQQRFGVSESGITIRMRTRQHQAIAVENRVVYDGETYEIRHVAKYPDAYVSLLRAI